MEQIKNVCSFYYGNVDVKDFQPNNIKTKGTYDDKTPQVNEDLSKAGAGQCNINYVQSAAVYGSTFNVCFDLNLSDIIFDGAFVRAGRSDRFPSFRK